MSTEPLTPLRQAGAAFEQQRRELDANKVSRGAGNRSRYFLNLFLASENSPPSEQVVIFSHIPKTGGSTLQEVIADNYPGSEDLHVVVDADPGQHREMKRWHRSFVASMTPDERSRLVAMTGHAAAYMAASLDRPVRKITMIRDPVDRVLSWFYYSNRNMARVKAGYTVRDMYERGAKADHCNGQARFLLAAEHDVSQLLLTKGPPPDADMWRSRLFAVLEDGYLIGVQDAYQASLERFAEVLGWSTTTVRTSKKVNDRRPRDLELDVETYELVRDMNWLDHELYEHYRQDYPEAVDPPGYSVKRPATKSRRTVKDLALDVDRARTSSQAELRAIRLRLEATQRQLEEQGAALTRSRQETEGERQALRARVKKLESEKKVQALSQRLKKLESEKKSETMKQRIKVAERRVAELEKAFASLPPELNGAATRAAARSRARAAARLAKDPELDAGVTRAQAEEEATATPESAQEAPPGAGGSAHREAASDAQ